MELPGAWSTSSHYCQNEECVQFRVCAHGECAAAGAVPDRIAQVRDSKDPDGPVLSFSTNAWDRFLDDLR